MQPTRLAAIAFAALLTTAAATTTARGFASVTREEVPKVAVGRPAAGARDVGGGTPTPLDRVEPTTAAPLSLRANRVRVAIRDQVAVVRVEHVLQSNVDRILQARYVLPLGEAAHLTGYAVWEAGVRLEGELLEVSRAEELYKKVTEQEVTARPEATSAAQEVRAVRVARDPGLLRQLAPDRFDMHVYPLLPWALKQVEVTYGEVVPAKDGRCRWSFPFELAAAFGEPVGEVLFEVTVEDSAGASELACDWPGAAVDGKTVRFQGDRVEARRPFEVTWRQGLAPLAVGALCHRVDPDPGHALVRVGLPAATTPDDAPLDVALAVDLSGSLTAAKWGGRGRVLGALADGLRPEDRVARLVFTDAPEAVDAAPAALDAAALRTWALDLPAGEGRTLLVPALREAAELLGPPVEGRRRLIVLSTDGVTEEEPGEVLVAARALGVRLLLLGTGADDDAELLGRLADVTGGAVWLPGTGERELLWAPLPEDVLTRPYGGGVAPLDSATPPDRLVRRFRDGAVFGAALEGAGLEVAPPARTFASGGTAAFLARYREPGTPEVRFRAWLDGRPIEGHASVTLPAAEPGHRFVAGLWARERTRELLRLHPWGPKDPGREEVVRLSLAHGFVTPYTAFLSLPDAERKRMLLGDRPAARDPWSHESTATPEAETWLLVLVAVGLVLVVERRRRTALALGAGA